MVILVCGDNETRGQAPQSTYAPSVGRRLRPAL
jgi:hypothetical protein